MRRRTLTFLNLHVRPLILSATLRDRVNKFDESLKMYGHMTNWDCTWAAIDSFISEQRTAPQRAAFPQT